MNKFNPLEQGGITVRVPKTPEKNREKPLGVVSNIEIEINEQQKKIKEIRDLIEKNIGKLLLDTEDPEIISYLESKQQELQEIISDNDQDEKSFLNQLNTLNQEIIELSKESQKYEISDDLFKETIHTKRAEHERIYPENKIIIDGKEYYFTKHLGSGGFKDVYKVELDGEQYAVALIRLDRLSKMERENLFDQLQNEFILSKKLDDIPTILQYHNLTFYDEQGNEIESSYNTEEKKFDFPNEDKEAVAYAEFVMDIVEKENIEAGIENLRREVLGDFSSIKARAREQVEKIKNEHIKDPDFLKKVEIELEMRLEILRSALPVEKKNFSFDKEQLRQKIIEGKFMEKEIEAILQEKIQENFKNLHKKLQTYLKGLITVAEGLDAMHAKEFAHNDIKPENLHPNMIIDLGLLMEENSRIRDIYGTPRYMEPGMFSENMGKFSYGSSHDKRAFAITMIETVCRALDFPTFTAHPTEKGDDGRIVSGSDIIKSSLFEYFSEEREKKYIQHMNFLDTDIKLPQVLIHAMKTYGDPELIEIQRKGISCENILQAVQEWVRTISKENYGDIYQKLKTLQSPEFYSQEDDNTLDTLEVVDQDMDTIKAKVDQEADTKEAKEKKAA